MSDQSKKSVEPVTTSPRSTEDPPVATPSRRQGRRLLRPVLLVVIPILAILGGGYLYVKGGRYVSTENAYIKANLIAVSANLDGRVVQVGVADHERVSKGRLLFLVDPEPSELEVAQAQAQLGVVQAEIESLRADHREALAQKAEAEERVAFLERQFQRQKKLRDQGMAREEIFDEASSELETSRRQMRVLDQRIARVKARLAGDPEIAIEAHPSYRRAMAALERATLDVADSAIYAPANGVVSNMRLQPGEYVEAGEPIFILIETESMWLEANLKETQLTHVAPGQQAQFTVDAYPDLKWDASVSSIAPATGAEFALLPPQNATGNWVKVVQRVPVRMDIQGKKHQPPLRAGMTVQVSIDTRQERDIVSLAEGIIGRQRVPDFLRQALAGNSP